MKPSGFFLQLAVGCMRLMCRGWRGALCSAQGCAWERGHCLLWRYHSTATNSPLVVLFYQGIKPVLSGVAGHCCKQQSLCVMGYSILQYTICMGQYNLK